MSEEQNGQNNPMEPDQSIEEKDSKKNAMKRYQIIIIVVAALIILGVAVFFIVRGTQKDDVALQTIDTADSGTELTEAVPVTQFQIGLDDVVAKVNGQPVTGEDLLASYEQIVGYYGEPTSESLELYYAVSMEEAITLRLIKLTAAEMDLDQFTQEELDALYATADSEWQYALDNYVSYNFEETDETTDEDRAAAYAEAESYYSMMGYTKDVLRQSYQDNEVFERLKDELCKDVTVTDDEVTAYYDEAVQSDKETYEFDIDAYENQLMMYQYGYAEQTPWYHPEGYRYVKHILLPVDEELMATYTDLLARYEEQMSAEEEEAATAETDAAAADTTATDIAETDAAATEAPETPVTAEDVDAAKAAVIASVQQTIDEINAKLAQGATFEDLVAEYGTDPGMTDGSSPDGYEVSLASYGFVPEFVSAAFSVDNIGEVSEPYLSEYGVHIVKYMGDVPAGPIELTDDMKALIHQDLLDDKCNTILSDWYKNADIEYTGVVRSIQEIQGDEAATDEAE